MIQTTGPWDLIEIGAALAAPQDLQQLAARILDLADEPSTEQAWLYLDEPDGLRALDDAAPALDGAAVGDHAAMRCVPLCHDGVRVGVLGLERSVDDPAGVEQLAPLFAAALASAGVYRTMEELVDQEMATAVSREQAIQLILDNMHEGLLVVGLDGCATEVRSRAVSEWLGEPPEGEPIWGWLAAGGTLLHRAFEVGFDQLAEDLMPFEVSVAQLPTRIERDGKVFGLSYTRVEEAGEFARVLIAFEDITLKIQAERDELALREMEAIVTALLANVAGFRDGLHEVQRLVGELADVEDVPVRERLLHTIKGSGAVLGFRTFAREIHDLEERAAESWTPAEVQQVEDAWTRSVEKLMPLLAGEEPGINLYPEEYARFLELLEEWDGAVALRRAAASWRAPTIGSTFDRFAMTAQRLAIDSGKSVRVEIRGGHCRIRDERHGAVVSALVHALRNALHHGIESVEERRAAGKPVVATLELEAEDRGGSLFIRIAEDGRGVPIEAVRKLGSAAGLPASASLFDCMCAGSTEQEAGMQAGRGVGLAALRDAVYGLGGSVVVDTTAGRGTALLIDVPTVEPDRVEPDGGGALAIT